MANIKKKALWIQAEGPNAILDNLDSWNKTVELIERTGFSDVFLQVFRRGQAWFASKNFERAASSSLLIEKLKRLNEIGVRTHAWVNVCNQGVSPGQSFQATLPKHAALRDSLGNLSTHAGLSFQIDTPGLWLDPASAFLENLVRSLITELLEYDFHGLHFDFIRYPYYLPCKPVSWVDCGPEFGYTKESLAEFLAGEDVSAKFIQTSISGLMPKDEASALEFDNWRRNKVTNLINIAKAALPQQIELSAACLAWSDRAYLNAFQNWRAWMQLGLLDACCLMTYTPDNLLLEQQIIQAKGFLQSNQKLYAGIGLYKLADGRALQRQLELCEQLSVNACLFCADQLLNRSDLLV